MISLLCQEFAKEVKWLKIEQDEELLAYDVSVLFPCIPVDKVFEIIRVKVRGGYRREGNATMLSFYLVLLVNCEVRTDREGWVPQKIPM